MYRVFTGKHPIILSFALLPLACWWLVGGADVVVCALDVVNSCGTFGVTQVK